MQPQIFTEPGKRPVAMEIQGKADRVRLRGLQLAVAAWACCVGWCCQGMDFDLWADGRLFGWSGFDASIYGDPDLDQAPNYVEFGRGTDPLAEDLSSAGHFPPRRTVAGDATEFSFAKMPGRAEVAWAYGVSNDLSTWHDVSGDAETATGPEGGPEQVTIRVADEAPPASTLFGRLAWSWLGAGAGDALLAWAFDAGTDLPTTRNSDWVTGGPYDVSRIGQIAMVPMPPGTLTIGSGGASGTDVTGEVPVTTWIRSDNPSQDKEDYHIYVGSLAGVHDLRGLLAVDLSAIPGDATITSATLSLYQSGYGTGNADHEPSQQVDLELFSMTGTLTNHETWNSSAGRFGSSLASSSGDPSVTTAGIEHTFNGPAVVAELQNALAVGTVYFGLASPDLEAQSIRHFFVLDGAPAENPNAPGAIGPSLAVVYTRSGGGNHLAEVPTEGTGGTLAAALAGDHYHELEVMGENPGGDLLTLVFDHYGAASGTDFTSSIAVFAGTNGFPTTPAEDDVLHISQVLVSASQDASVPVDTAIVPLARENLAGTLTLRLYFFDDASHSGSFTRVDGIRVDGFSPEHVIVQYAFDDGSTQADNEVPAAVSGETYTVSLGGVSALSDTAYASTQDTADNLGVAIAEEDYHEFVVTVNDPRAVLLALQLDHQGSSPADDFLSNIAVFSSIDGFASPPVPAEALAVSTVVVSQGQSGTEVIATAEVPLALTGFSGELTVRLYFYDDVDLADSFNRIGSVRVIGDAPGVGLGQIATLPTEQYTIQIEDPGFRVGVITPRGMALPADPDQGLSFLGSAVESSERLSQTGDTTRFRVTNGNGETAVAEFVTGPHAFELSVQLEDGRTGDIRMRMAGPGPAYGLADRGSFESNANLAAAQKTYPIKHNGHTQRFLSGFLLFPQRGSAGAFFQPKNGEVSIGPDYYEMANTSCAEQTFHYYVGPMEEIYAAYRDTRVAEGFPGVPPKPVCFETGWETWGLLGWNTNARTVQDAINDFRSRGYNLKWFVTGSGFWDNTDTVTGGGTTVSFGDFHPTKYPDPPAPGDITLRQFADENDIQWLIGQRVNFVKLGGPFLNPSGPGESGQYNYATSPNTQEGIDLGYFLKDDSDHLVELASTVFPVVPSHVLDGNVQGSAEWFSDLHALWGVDGVKEDTMLDVPDHTVYNAPMRAISQSGKFVMARCAAYSSPGTITRINDPFGASTMSLRSPINALQYAAVGAPNAYIEVVGFRDIGNVKRTLRHGWLLSCSPVFAFSEVPWTAGWSASDQDKLKKIYDFHYRYGPYKYSAAVDSFDSGYPYTMTPLPVAFPGDTNTYDLAGSTHRQFEWLIGESMLAAPALADNSGVSLTTDVYLPEGTWIDYEDGTQYTGPVTLADFSMPHDKVPVFVGGKGVVVARSADEAPLQAEVFPVAAGGPSYTFHYPDGGGDTTIHKDNVGWDSATLVVSNVTGSSQASYTSDPITGAIRFDILPGNDYVLSD